MWDIKLIPGGLIDLEFIAQAAILTGNVEARGARVTGTADILARLSPRFADAQARQELCDADALYSSLTQMIRLCLTGPFARKEVPPGLTDLLIRITDLPDIGVLEAHVKETAQRVRSHFGRLLRAGGS
jgi:glutamate-ammonia-ligase adenylyltransferase